MLKSPKPLDPLQGLHGLAAVRVHAALLLQSRIENAEES
jgi:hypothetical protein